MNLHKPLILVEDDTEDQEMIVLALSELGCKNQVIVFRDAESALTFLYESDNCPFLIISDINMPKMDGLTFKETIEACSILKPKKIPFVFLSTASTDNYIRKAYDVCAQGFFEKGASFLQLKEALSAILKYWQKTKHLN